MGPENPFAANAVGELYARGRPYHHPRSLARIRTLVGDAPCAEALDVACGTGMSTVALSEHAARVVGLDASPEMMRVAPTGAGRHYLLGNAERLPFPDATFDAATCCSGVHWFDQRRFFTELRRVLRPNAWVGLYDHYFIGEMVDVPAFAAWAGEAMERYPLPERNHQVGDPRTNTPPGFEKIADEFYNDDRAMTQDAFVDYQLTISNFVAAAERGTPRTELRDWLMLSTDPLFGGAETRIVRFLGSITCLRRLA
ncbi:MAG TPA: class I SAM-dependent methyltransferase [Acidimicrobiia bacterium]|nr:class I SAM-dependent methyltransferase [Acidimicrobiia bacterium]